MQSAWPKHRGLNRFCCRYVDFTLYWMHAINIHVVRHEITRCGHNLWVHHRMIAYLNQMYNIRDTTSAWVESNTSATGFRPAFDPFLIKTIKNHKTAVMNLLAGNLLQLNTRHQNFECKIIWCCFKYILWIAMWAVISKDVMETQVAIDNMRNKVMRCGSVVSQSQSELPWQYKCLQRAQLGVMLSWNICYNIRCKLNPSRQKHHVHGKSTCFTFCSCGASKFVVCSQLFQ